MKITTSVLVAARAIWDDEYSVLLWLLYHGVDDDTDFVGHSLEIGFFCVEDIAT